MKSNVIKVDFRRVKVNDEVETQKSIDMLYIRNKMLDISGWWIRLTFFLTMTALAYLITN